MDFDNSRLDKVASIEVHDFSSTQDLAAGGLDLFQALDISVDLGLGVEGSTEGFRGQLGADGDGGIGLHQLSHNAVIEALMDDQST